MLRVTWEPCDSDWKGQPEYYIVEHRKCGGVWGEHETGKSITKAPIEINYARHEHPEEVRVYAVNESGRSEDSVISIVDKGKESDHSTLRISINHFQIPSALLVIPLHTRRTVFFSLKHPASHGVREIDLQSKDGCKYNLSI